MLRAGRDTGGAGDAPLLVGFLGVPGVDRPGGANFSAGPAAGAGAVRRGLQRDRSGRAVRGVPLDAGPARLRQALQQLCALTGKILKLPQILLVRPPGGDVGEDGVLRDRGGRRDHPEALSFQQLLQLEQRVVIVPVAVDRRDDRGRFVAADAAQPLGAGGGNPPGEDRRPGDQQIVRTELRHRLALGQQVAFPPLFLNPGRDLIDGFFGRSRGAEVDAPGVLYHIVRLRLVLS